MTIRLLKERYFILCHAIQSGVSVSMQINNSDTTPKHLRTGINTAHVSNHALVTLLIKKGLITEYEYWESLVNSSFDEVKKYEDELTEKLGKKVTLI